MPIIISLVLVVLGLILFLVAVLGVIAVYGYKRLAFDFKPLHVYPRIKINLGSVVATIFSIVRRNPFLAVGGMINGIKMDGQINFCNRSLVPIYLPVIENQVLVEGSLCLNIIKLEAKWLKPGETRTEPVCVTLSAADIPMVALGVLTRGGRINIEIRSRLNIGPFFYHKVTKMVATIPNPLTRTRRAKRFPRVSPPAK